uniref:Glutaredoxin n=1 Tax=Parascaris univalens TaxID=6257 RepID=A0A915BLZ6_PARUN
FSAALGCKHLIVFAVFLSFTVFCACKLLKMFPNPLWGSFNLNIYQEGFTAIARQEVRNRDRDERLQVWQLCGFCRAKRTLMSSPARIENVLASFISQRNGLTFVRSWIRYSANCTTNSSHSVTLALKPSGQGS